MTSHDDLLNALGIGKQPQPQQTETTATNSDHWKTAAAKAHGLPDALADRLTGNTEVAIYLDAQRLAEAVAPPKEQPAEAVLLAKAALANAARVESILPGTDER